MQHPRLAANICKDRTVFAVMLTVSYTTDKSKSLALTYVPASASVCIVDREVGTLNNRCTDGWLQKR